MAITFVGGNVAVQSPAGTTVTVDVPDGVEAGDTMIAIVSHDSTASGVAGSASAVGWTLLRNDQTTPGGPGVALLSQNILTKTAVDFEPGSYTFTVTNSSIITGIILVYRGVLTVDLHDVAKSDSSSSIVAPSLDLTVDNELLLAIWGTTANVATLTVPSGANVTTRVNQGSLTTMAVAVNEEMRGQDETTGTRTATAASNGAVIGYAVGFKPIIVAAQFYQDNYKAKVMRSSLPPIFDRKLTSNIGKLVSIIGTSDNFIGGQFGDADFLPDETP